MRRPLIPLLFLTGGVLALDLATKRWASEVLQHRPPVPVLGEFVRLTFTKNSGVAFGLGAGTGFPYAIFSIFAAVIILYLFFAGRVAGSARKVALALILGGALGNLVDRLTSGEVVDFIEVGWNRWHWPVFNVADSAVSIGVVLFALAWSRRDGHEPDAVPAPGVAAEERPPGARALRDEPDAGPVGAGAPHRGAARPLPGDGADRPVA